MLVLVSFVLVLAAAVTLVVGLLQSGLTLIYLSIGCSVLAGVVLAVAVLRGRPEPKAAPIGRPYTPPASAPPVRASVGAPASSATETTSFTPPPPAPPTPSTPPAPPARGVSDDAATKAAGTALLGRLRGRRGQEPPADATPESEPEPVSAPEPVTMEMPAVSAEADDDFPIPDYDKLRATDLLRRLGSLDRNQLEAVRERETAGKNRFTILSRVDVLLAAQAEPAWEVDDDEWESHGDAAPSDAAVIPVGPVADDDELAAGEIEDDEADEVDVDQRDEVDLDEVDELVSPVDEFPIANYDSLTVGQILPRLSDLNADELAQVRAREQQGRARGTILDRIERLAAKSGAMAMPAPAAPARRSPAARKAPARKAPGRKAATAIPVPPATSTTPMKEAVKKASARKSAAAAKAPGPVTKSPTGRKAAPPVVKKATAKKAAVAPATKAEAAPAKSPGRRKAVPPIVPAETAAPTKAAVKKARAAKATKRP